MWITKVFAFTNNVEYMTRQNISGSGYAGTYLAIARLPGTTLAGE
jgi:hypothetical protein